MVLSLDNIVVAVVFGVLPWVLRHFYLRTRGKTAIEIEKAKTEIGKMEAETAAIRMGLVRQMGELVERKKLDIHRGHAAQNEEVLRRNLVWMSGMVWMAVTRYYLDHATEKWPPSDDEGAQTYKDLRGMLGAAWVSARLNGKKEEEDKQFGKLGIAYGISLEGIEKLTKFAVGMSRASLADIVDLEW